MIIAEVRSHGDYGPGMRRIKNSIRVESNRLKQEPEALRELMVPWREIYLSCSCLRDTASVRVMHLPEQGTSGRALSKGGWGMKSWVKAGGAVERVPACDVQKLPQFDSIRGGGAFCGGMRP
jgi:hypothetical protein